MRTTRLSLSRLLVGFAGVATLLVTNAAPAAALTKHTITVQPGSAIDISGGRRFPLAGNPQCSDTIDNDQDGSTDSPADADCDPEVGGLLRPATQDNNECQDGFQAQPAPSTITFQDNGAGALSAFNIALPAADVCASTLVGQLCFRVTITVNSAAATGTVSNIVANTSANVSAGAFAFTVAVGTCGYKTPPGFSATNCKVTFSNVNFSTTHVSPRGAGFHGVQYTEGGGTGQGTLATRIPSGPSFGAGTCGSFFGTDYATELNTNLGLPNAVDVVLVGTMVPDLSSV